MEHFLGHDIAWWEITFAGIGTIAVFSFLIKENPFYRFFEHLFIGVATAIGIIIATKSFLWPKVIKPIFGFDTIYFPDGTAVVPYDPTQLYFLIRCFSDCCITLFFPLVMPGSLSLLSAQASAPPRAMRSKVPTLSFFRSYTTRSVRCM